MSGPLSMRSLLGGEASGSLHGQESGHAADHDPVFLGLRLCVLAVDAFGLEKSDLHLRLGGDDVRTGGCSI
jgi:hypothetical protein